METTRGAAAPTPWKNLAITIVSKFTAKMQNIEQIM